MRTLLPALLLIAACAAPDPSDGEVPVDTTRTEAAAIDTSGSPDAEPIEEPGFDAAAWIALVEATESEAELVALSSQLLDAVDWRVACGEDDPTATGRGVVRLVRLAPTSVLAEITCQRFETQSTFALVDAEAGKPPRLVRALGVTDRGTVVADTTASFFGTLMPPTTNDEDRFSILTLSADEGGCGTDAAYRLRPNGGASVVEVRAHTDCDAPLPTEEWPVSYPLE